MSVHVRCRIVRWTDDRFPGWVEAQLTDAQGRLWTFEDKVPIFTADTVTRETRLPVDAVLRCRVVSRQRSESRDLVTVRTRDLDPELTFDVTPDELTDA